jgi:hypothetical protein
MAPSTKRSRAGRLGQASALLAIALGACSGDIQTDRPRPIGPLGFAGFGAYGAGAGGAAVPNPSDRMADDAMRAADPNLFQIAMNYFPNAIGSGGKKRLFRLTRLQLDRTTQALFPEAYATSAQETLPRDPLQTNYEFADNLSWNPANFAPYIGWTAAIAERVRADPKRVVDCSAEGDAPTCLDTQARRFVTRAFRGVTADAQLARFSRFFVDSAAAVGLPTATADLVDVTLTSPGYVFREEVLTDARSSLLPAQLLQNVTYTLADMPPEALGLAPAEAALHVGDAQALQRTLDRVLASPEARAKLLRFFFAWLEIREPAEFTIATTVFPEFTPEVAAATVTDTTRFLEQQLATPAPKLKDITTTTRAVSSAATAFLYGPGARAAGPVELDPTQRLGVFTQPAVIASHSGPTNSRLVKRGVFFTRKVMCLPLGAPPPGTDTTVPMTPNATERQKIESATGKQPCQGCHMFINPFGFMQESFDAIGRFRTRDGNLPIDPSISVGFLDEGPLEAKTSVDALKALVASARFKQCFTRQLFRFYLGRDEVATDDPLLRRMFFAFARADEQDLFGMLRLLSGSEEFAQRTEGP